MSPKMSDDQELRNLLKRYALEETNSFSGFSEIEVNTAGHEKVTPLHMACTRSAVRDVELLLAGGADVGARTNIGHTPLHCAVYERNAAIVRLLLAAGADPETPSDFGETPVNVAIKLQLFEIERLLKSGQGQ
ncbi:MAG: ankyrin repeat domain-containing protein [Hyphomicrobium sp.]